MFEKMKSKTLYILWILNNSNYFGAKRDGRPVENVHNT